VALLVTILIVGLIVLWSIENRSPGAAAPTARASPANVQSAVNVPASRALTVDVPRVGVDPDTEHFHFHWHIYHHYDWW
jgi:hypothetical protein